MTQTNQATDRLLNWDTNLPAAHYAVLGNAKEDRVEFFLMRQMSCYRRGIWKLLIEVCGGPNHYRWGCFDEQDQPVRYYHSKECALSEAESIARVLLTDRLKHGELL